MDTLDSLIIRHGFSGNEVLVDLNQAKEDGILFEFNEYEEIAICLNSQNCSVSLECLCYKINDEITYCDNVLVLENNVTYTISAGAESDTVGYLPSRYRINITYADAHQISSYFNVSYNYEVSHEGMEKVIGQIENFISGLSLDYFRQVPVSHTSEQMTTEPFWIYEVLMNEQNKIIYYTNRIMNNFRLNIHSCILRESVPEKQNPATVRKNIQKNSQEMNRYYNVKKVPTSYTDENIQLKRILNRLMMILKEIPSGLDRFYEQKIARSEFLENELNELRFKSEKKPSRFSKVMNDNYGKVLNEEIRENENWCMKIAGWKTAYVLAVRNISRMLHSEELEGVDIRLQRQVPPGFLNTPEYRYFMELMNKLNFNRTSVRGYTGNFIFRKKKSYELFELYGFILIQNILNEVGFTLNNEEERNIFQFGSESVMTFEKGENRVKVYYDHFCPRRYSSKAGDNDVVTVNSTHCKPDYILCFYDQDHEVRDMIILDMKYRRLKKMINITEEEMIPSDVDDILTDYSQLEIKGTRKRPVLAGVIYPSMKEEVVRRFDGLYIGIDVLKNFSESRGYHVLKSLIMKQIQ